MSPHAVRRQREALQARIHRVTAVPLAVLAVIWTALLFVELVVRTPAGVSTQINRVDETIWLIFALDFVVEFSLAPNRRRYLRNHVFSALSLVLPFVRAFELVRLVYLLRTTSLIRILLIANRAAGGAGKLFRKHRFDYVAFLAVITALLGAATEYFLEQGVPGSPFQNFGTALWWSLAMLTTVPSQADPVTAEGRFVGLIVRVVALAIGGYVTASIASYLIGQQRDAQEPAIGELIREIEALRAQLAEYERERGSVRPDEAA